ncbi:concanavalin A-like lectin/glucanase domain-containing protein [Neocallimastix lanati (nom. inval.)]|nr:concanavalin A-like lectin/glucanase domain-containing protein [Neocallimastix sp. JGI-2020a]
MVRELFQWRKVATSLVLAGLLFTNKSSAIDACQQTQQLSGGRTIYNKNETGRGNGNYRYEIWRDGNGGELTLYPKDACFKASWNNAGDFLGRVGLVWDNKPNYKNLGGDLIANYSYKKSGNDGGTYSYVGVYGWMDNPQIEYYVVDDWLHNRGAPGGSYMGSQKGTITVDGGTYKVWSGTRTGASKWGQSTFTQIFSVRTEQRTCGQINISEHFRQWEKLGLRIGSVMEAQILAESGGGSGYVDYTYATVEIVNPNSNNNNNDQKNDDKEDEKVDTTCWSKKLGYPCCSNKNASVEYTDGDGQWGIENGDWCGIVSGGKSCWSQRLGYPCCTNNSAVYFTDNDGKWGIQNDDWCGIN